MKRTDYLAGLNQRSHVLEILDEGDVIIWLD